jgi:hypothetical protein
MSTTHAWSTFAAVAWAGLIYPARLYAQEQPAPPKPVVTVVSGDPSAPGPFVLRVAYPAGFHNDPHRHNIDLTGTVLRGQLMMGQGTRFDTSGVVAVDSGRTTVVKAGRDHFDWWPRGGELEIRGVGPLATVPADRGGTPAPAR